MIVDMLSNIKVNPIVTELFFRGKKLSIYFVFFISTHQFIMEISNKQELQQIAFNHSSYIDFKDFMNLCKKCIAKPYYFWSV